MINRRHLQALCLSLCISLILSACSVQTKQLDVTPDIDNAFHQQGSLTTSAKWWLNFNDAQLEQLVDIGLKNNLSLSATLAKVNSAQASLGMSQANLYPSLNLTASAGSDIEKLDAVDTSSVSLVSTWELDLWGRISSLVEKDKWNLVAKQAAYKAQANTVAGNITNAWFGWLAEHDKKRMYADQYKRTNTALKVINRRFAMGKNSITDVWQQKRLLETIVADQAVNDARIAIFEKQLALWLGIRVSTLPALTNASLPVIPKLPKMGLPLTTLQYRPDIQQSFANLQASNASLAAAATERFPRLSLRANYSTSQSNVRDLFDDWSGNLIASLAMPIFDAGSTEAKIKQNEYNLDAAFANYKQTWLAAIFSVEKSLITEQQLSMVANNIDIQMSLAKKTERVVSTAYVNGKSSYLTLLKAQETSLKLERQVVDAQRALINNRVELYRELSHGDFSEPAKEQGSKQDDNLFPPISITDENS